MQVLEIMKTHVVKTTGDATLSEAADLIDLYQTTGLLVVDADGGLQGMLTESDLVRAVRTVAGPLAGLQRVRAWMTTPAISISECAEIEEAFRVLYDSGMKRLPVLDDTGQVVGVLNRIDLLQAVFEGAVGDVNTNKP